MVVEGDALDLFVEKLRSDAPPLSRIMDLQVSPGEYQGFPDFSIKESEETGSFTLLSPDVAVCGDCLRELFDKNDRRYLYPFINCTNCGPRYSITESVPYDRSRTTMKVFDLCPACEREYRDPRDRRFHAQPNACAKCGPRVTMPGGEAQGSVKRDPIEETIGLLREGKIVAVKGLGGFHICCDAANGEAVERLRLKKRRSNKPFALMAPDVGTIRRFCYVSSDEEALLNSRERPIVLLRKKDDNPLPDAVSPKNSFVGFMLPYTPLHYQLFYHPCGDGLSCHFSCLVMTSGNISEEPIVIDNDEAVDKLSDIADAFLVHDRGIFMRVDDSVVRKREGTSESGKGLFSFIRRSRGYVPGPILLHEDGPDVLGCGAEVKNTFTLTKGRYAIPSQHIGDMENFETLRFFEETLRNLKSVYRAEPEAVAYDLHPRYLSTQWALSKGLMSGKVDSGVDSPRDLPAFGIQHHYAHIASVMAEKGIKEKVIGVAFDGTGYAGDGTLWGGEFFIADIFGFTRAGHLDYVALPGGEQAIREPWKTAVSCLKKISGKDFRDHMELAGFFARYGREKVVMVGDISEKKDFSPLSSGAGRLFDAVSALLGVCDRNTFEGEAAIALEAAVFSGIDDLYPYDVVYGEPAKLCFSRTFLSILDDIGRREEVGVMAAKFHNTLAESAISVVRSLAAVTGIGKILLSGGTFQNDYLMRRVDNGLRSLGLEVFTNELVPCNDGGISLGQAYIARERLKAGLIEKDYA